MLASSHLGPYSFFLARAVKSSSNSPSTKLPKWWVYPRPLPDCWSLASPSYRCRLRGGPSNHLGAFSEKKRPSPVQTERIRTTRIHSEVIPGFPISVWFRPGPVWFRSLCFVFRALRKYSLHTIKFTCLCTSQWFLVHLQSWATVTTVPFLEDVCNP